MSYRGDYNPGQLVKWEFNTVLNGLLAALSGSPACTVYRETTTPDTSGLTLTASFNSITGLNKIEVDTSADPTFYAEQNDFSVVFTAGTVGGQSVVGRVLMSFSLKNRSAGNGSGIVILG